MSITISFGRGGRRPRLAIPQFLKRRRTYKPRITLAPTRAAPARLLQWIAVGLVVLGTCYNAGLAVVNAHGHQLSGSVVAASEIAILGLGVLLLIPWRLDRGDAPHVALLAGYVAVALISSIGADMPFPDPIRNFGIIAVFAILGRRAEQRDIEHAFLIVTLLTLAVLVLEMVSTETYVSLFQPDLYYTATRGTTKSDFNDTGLVGSALGFASRFSFGIFTGHRTSSLFLEQVSLANYAGVLAIYLMSFWKRLGLRSRFLYCGVILLILISNNTRTSSGLAVLLLAGYFIFPLVPRLLTFVIGPSMIASAYVLTGGSPTLGEDDLRGRLSITVNALDQMTIRDLAGLHIQASKTMYDSGYGYVLTSTGLIGLLLLWFYVSLVVPRATPETRRCAFALSLYIFLNMLIGGTAIFSMKVAALLWFLAGFMTVSAAQTQSRQSFRA